MQLRPRQATAKDDVYGAWGRGDRNVLLRYPTGGGKTVIFSNIIKEYVGTSYAIAHRAELVSQMALTLARNEVYHNITAPDASIREIVKIQQRELGRVFYNTSAPCNVAGVDTLIRREIPEAAASRVGLWVVDEGHHLLEENKWGKTVAMFPNAYGLGPTASPKRADGKGLGRHADGLFDFMVDGPSTRELIEEGNLSDFEIHCPPSDMDTTCIPTGASGEFTQKGLKTAADKSRIVGDVVAHYLKIAAGKLGVTFVTDVENAMKIASQYRAAGVPAEVITAKTPARVRAEILRRFENRELLQLVNVDILGEGFDCPAIEVVSMARPTQSLSLFMQQFGRALRPMPGKDRAIIIDHVLNCVRHRLEWMEEGYPWSLDARAKQGGDTTPGAPVRVCVGCGLGYAGVSLKCPYCGHVSEPESRAAPEFVDGVLSQLSPEALAELRGLVIHASRSPEAMRDAMIAHGTDEKIAWAAAKNLRVQQTERVELRKSIAWYAGHLKHKGRNDDEINFYFYEQFGTDIMTAQTLGKADTEKLNTKIIKELEKWQ